MGMSNAVSMCQERYCHDIMNLLVFFGSNLCQIYN